ncbi:MAG: IS66 family transposase [Lachnospiraceae bacterium]|nr:IS66 family transposase [Lachnospiraceae bacterium]
MWLKEQQEHCTYLPKSKTGKGVGYFLNQEKYLKVFLTDGDVPMDNSASERSIRPFTIGRKNWLLEKLMPWSEEIPEECRKSAAK